MSSKLPAPQRSDNYLRRPRLYSLLPRKGIRLVLLAGYAGSGKTALVREWLEATDDVDAAWVQPGTDGDGTSLSFWTTVIERLSSCDERYAGPTREEVLETGRITRDILAGAIEGLRFSGRDLALVLDGYDAISDDETHRPLAWFLDRCPPALTVVMTTRREPPLPLGRWRARGELAELREPELRLTAAEVAALFPRLDQDGAAALTEQTDGWAAAVKVAGDGGDVTEILLREGWRNQPEHVREFLAATSILDSFNASLCDAVLDRSDSAGLLADLVSRHVFILPAEHSGRWYRFQRLFAGALRAELRAADPGREQTLQRRAARWYADCGLPARAFRYAVAGGDHDLAINQVSSRLLSLSARGEWRALLSTVSASSDGFAGASPARALDYAWLLAANGFAGRAAAIAKRAVNGSPGDLPPSSVVTAAVIEVMADASAGDDAAFFSRAVRVGEMVTHEHPGAAAWVLTEPWMLGLTERFDESEAGFALAARDAGPASSLQAGARSAVQAEILVWEGRLREAAAEIRSASVAWPAGGFHPAVGASRRAQASIQLEAGALDEAEAALREAQEIEDSTYLPMQGALIAVGLAALERARGRPDTAIEHLDRVEQTRYALRPGRLFHCYLAEARVRAALELGDLAQADRTLRAGVLPGATVLLEARLALASDDHDAAISALAGNNWPSLRRRLEAHLIRAAALRRVDDDRAAAEAKMALDLGLPAGFARIFQDEPDLSDLYEQIVMKADPLSALSSRELDVLRLLAKDLSYKNVADELFVSLNTVKVHARNVYRKLDVHDRAEAVRQAAELGLL